MQRVEQILKSWHKHFEDENNHYSGFEPSDIEYFVGCMLYNEFAFSKALESMKTMDLSYDFLENCGDIYDEVVEKIHSLALKNEEEKLQFLQEYIQKTRTKYEESELYLLNRFAYHIDAMAQRYVKNVDAKPADFTNPLLR